MPVHLQWLYKDRIVLQQFHGILTTEDITQMVDSSEKMVDQGTAPVHTLVDSMYLVKYPTNLATMRRAISTTPNTKLGWVILVQQNNPLLKFLGSMLAQLAVKNVRLRIFDNHVQALEFLVSMDSTLTDEVRHLALPVPPKEHTQE